ncbi:hypothetical protein TNCV_1082881 [Trichonephila clavipes]|nr:hypothetical protein TNCV_1082881 [Trichonephila clavipes]
MAEELGRQKRYQIKMTNIELRNIISVAKITKKRVFVRDQLSVILEERLKGKVRKNRQAARNRGEEKIARQHAIQQPRWESGNQELLPEMNCG